VLPGRRPQATTFLDAGHRETVVLSIKRMPVPALPRFRPAFGSFTSGSFLATCNGCPSRARPRYSYVLGKLETPACQGPARPSGSVRMSVSKALPDPYGMVLCVEYGSRDPPQKVTLQGGYTRRRCELDSSDPLRRRANRHARCPPPACGMHPESDRVLARPVCSPRSWSAWAKRG